MIYLAILGGLAVYWLMVFCLLRALEKNGKFRQAGTIGRTNIEERTDEITFP